MSCLTSAAGWPPRALRSALPLAIAAAVLLGACAEQRIRDEAQIQSRAGDYEQAMEGLQSGLKTFPDSALLKAGVIQTRTEAVTRMLAMASTARSAGRLDDAERSLRRAQTLQPADQRIEAQITDLAVERRQRAALAEAEAFATQRKPVAALGVINEALRSNPRQSELLALKLKLDAELRQAQVRAAQLGLAETRPISLDFRDATLVD